MKATKLASSDHERARLRGKCKELLLKAEEIKQAVNWTPAVPGNQVNLKAPSSQRPVTNAEEIILLEGSKLHGFVFPPWKADPEDSVFEDTIDGKSLYRYFPHTFQSRFES